jgi:hypothetical protein
MLGTSLALLRAYVGWATTWATLLGTDTPGTATLSGAAFRFSTAAGDANWQAVTFNGASQTVVDTGVPPVVAVSQKFEIVRRRHQYRLQDQRRDGGHDRDDSAGGDGDAPEGRGPSNPGGRGQDDRRGLDV